MPTLSPKKLKAMQKSTICDHCHATIARPAPYQFQSVELGIYDINLCTPRCARKWVNETLWAVIQVKHTVGVENDTKD